MNATIDKGWHLYSQYINMGGPLPTVFTFEPSSNYELDGKTSESKPIDYYDDTYDELVL